MVRLRLRADARVRNAACDFTQPREGLADKWRRHLSHSSSVVQQDSVEFLESALSKWRLYEARGRAVASENALKQIIDTDSKIDALGVLTIEASGVSLDESLGICQFRRTWSNNITVDYLAVHPALLVPSPPVSGVGTALLYYLATLAKRIDAQRVWLETTDSSVGYYSYLFGIPSESDLLNISTYAFHQRLEDFFKKS